MNLVYRNILEESNINLTDFTCADGRSLLKQKGLYKIIWAKDDIADLSLDGCPFILKKDEVLFCTPLNFIDIPMRHEAIAVLVFNREFYCIRDNDHEVSCNGLLFYGSSMPVTIDLDEKGKNTFRDTYKILQEEFDYCDTTQGEMLRIMLKHLIIKSTRSVKGKMMGADVSQSQVDMIRRFNILVEKHYRDFHQVSDYAPLLHKSPKTLYNTFSKYSDKTPLTLINERLLLEARRLLLFSNKTVEEIAYELGFNDASHFSKFFTKNKCLSPVKFKKETLAQLNRE
ncbi:MAG TPA: AraC family transcriptional regulator [Pricia sp.]|nr:AraC family transcriptional regulator [Pricia sp.]